MHIGFPRSAACSLLSRMSSLQSASSQPEPAVRDRSRTASSPPAAPRAVTPRAVGLGLLRVPLLCWWTLKHELIWGGSEFVEASLVVIAVFMLFLMVLLNTALRRWAPRVVFSQGELLTVYVMLT